MMNRMAAIMVCIVLVFSMVSCDDQGKAVGYGSLSVEISNGDNSKTVRPADESLAFASYRIEGRHRTIEGRTVDETFTGGNIEIDRLETGDWEFMVEGLNKDKVVLAKSEAHIVTIKTNGTAKETYTLDWIEGHGTLSLSVKVQTSRVSTIECKLYDEDGSEAGTYVMTKDDSRLDDEGFLVFEHSFTNVPTGSYDATITMKDKDGGMIGRALHPSVHIHDRLVSSYGFSWENFKNLLPSVDAPKVTNIGEGATTVPCDLTILLGTEETGTTIFYSLDGKSYSKYQEGAIDLSAMGNLNDSIAVWTYAEKANLNKSAVAEYAFNIEHKSPDRANATYVWNVIEGGYECIATSKCKYHKSVECETEKAVASYQVITDSTCSKEGVGRYTAEFAKKGYKVQTNEERIPVLGHELEHHVANDPTCTEIGWDEYDTCTRCDYTTYKEIDALGHDKVHHEAKAVTCTEIGWDEYDTCKRCEYTTYKEIDALGHNYLLVRVDDEYHCQVCSRCKAVVDKEFHSFKDYKCETCGTWGKGPSGGYVFYDCDADNDSSVNNGRGEDYLMSSECGWRYLEAAPADLRLVDGKPTVDSTMQGYLGGTFCFIFGYYRETNDGDCIELSTSWATGKGSSNTDILVGKMQDAAYEHETGTGTTSSYAARLCNILEYEVNGKVFNDWFLPSQCELILMYKNLYKQGLVSFFINCGYWSSSESSCYGAYYQRFDNGYEGVCSRDGTWYDCAPTNIIHRVRPIRAF